MPFRNVEKPLPMPEAFASTSDEAVLSQAAVLLLMGHSLRGHVRRFRLGTLSAAPVSPVDLVEDGSIPWIPPEDLEAIGYPGISYQGERFLPIEVRKHVSGVHGVRISPRSPIPERWAEVSRALPGVADAVHKSQTPMQAAELLETCLVHEQELVRVAAAASYYSLSTDSRRLTATLAKGTQSEDPLVRDVAATALARISPGHSSVTKLIKKRPGPSTGGEPAHTSLLIHGTFARNSTWWQPPDGDFFRYLRNEAGVTDLYGAADRFEWSGGYSDEARSLAASDLAAWIKKHRDQQAIDDSLKLFAHSHGANVAMLATHSDVGIQRLFLLSCPVHVPKYTPKGVLRTVSIRVHLDLVILADFGGQRFPSSLGIQEIVLPIWFNHFATHDPQVWRDNNLPTRI